MNALASIKNSPALAGDIWGKTPIWHSLRAFKVLYYLSSLRHLPRSLRAWRRRQFNIRAVDDALPMSKG